MPEEEETVTMKVQEQKEPKVQIAKATVDSTRGLLDEDEISKGIKSKMMLDPLQTTRQKLNTITDRATLLVGTLSKQTERRPLQTSPLVDIELPCERSP